MPATPRFRNAALIYNPLSGRLRWKRQRDLDRATHLLDAYGIRIVRIPTTGAGSATALAREQVAAGRDLIIACGGDGTVNEVVNGMAGSRVPLALLPAGTGNVLAKELGLPWDIWRAAEYIPAGEVRRIALGRAGERYFICMAGVGVDANIVYRLSVKTKLSLGMLAYWIESFRQLLEYEFPLFSVRVEGQSFQAALLVVSRTKNYGGPVQLTRRADLFSDEFEVCLFQRRNRFLYLLYFLALQAGLLERFRDVHFLRTRRVEAQPGNQRIQVQVDGELAGALPMDFVIVPEALSLLVPRSGGR
ncbi:MAG: diacylglycerol kinase family lipid kinase [Acidobacteria bacterium]|nr:diacylglycerol kinase family lipid kinase [Acidobacteriota bacterium]